MNPPKPRHRNSRHPQRMRWYFVAAMILLIFAAGLRVINLTSAPPGMSTDELINAQLADRMRGGDFSLIFTDTVPAREGLYFALLAGFTAITGPGVLFWRLPSALIAMLSLAMTTTLAKRLFGTRVAILTLGLMGLSFWPVWLGRAVHHYTLMPLLVSLVVYVLVRTFLAQGKAQTALWFTASGLVIGFAQYGHVTAWALLLLPVVFILARWFIDPVEIRPHWGNVFYAVGLFFVMIVPLTIFLVANPGTRVPSGLGTLPEALMLIPQHLVGTLAGLVVRGDIFANINLPARPLLGPFSALLMVIGFGVSIARWRRPGYALVIIWLITGLLPTLLALRSPNFEHMIVLMPVAFMLPGIGLREVYIAARDRMTGWDQLPAFLMGINALVVVIIGVNMALTVRDYFDLWANLRSVQEQYQAETGALVRYLDTTNDPTPIVVCAPRVDRIQRPFALTNDQLLATMMHRRDLRLRYFDCTQSLLFTNGGEEQRMIFPRAHYYEQIPGPLLVWMSAARSEAVSGVGPDTVMRIEISQAIADKAGAFITTAPTAWAPETGEFRLAELPVSFGHNVTFLGYELRDDTLRSSDYVELTTYWRLDGPPPPELTMFAHLLGNPVVVLAQNDNLGVNVSQLDTRDVFIQYSLLQTPPGITTGLYPVSVGLYLPSTGQRLEAFEGEQARGDRLFLQRITIK